MTLVKVRIPNKEIHPLDKALLFNLLMDSFEEDAYIEDDYLYGTVSTDNFSALCVLEDLGVLEVEQC